MTRLETGFRDVDAAGDAASYAGYLSHVNGLESVAAGKRERARMLGLRPGSRAIDVGCGLGDDARALSRLVGEHGEVVGVDSSTALLERAQARCEAEDGPVKFIAGDAHELPLDADAFDAARTERTLQHLEDPARVVSELARDFDPDVIVDLPLLAEDLRAQGHEGVEDLLAAAKTDTLAGRTVAALTLFTVLGRR